MRPSIILRTTLIIWSLVYFKTILLQDADALNPISDVSGQVLAKNDSEPTSTKDDSGHTPVPDIVPVADTASIAEALKLRCKCKANIGGPICGAQLKKLDKQNKCDDKFFYICSVDEWVVRERDPITAVNCNDQQCVCTVSQHKNEPKPHRETNCTCIAKNQETRLLL